MTGYSARDVAKLLELRLDELYGFVKAGFLSPARGSRGEYRFTFQDLVLLRTAKGLVRAKLPARRVKRALTSLRRQLPSDRPLSGVQIAAEGDTIVVRDGDAKWIPESGQVLFDFGVAELAEKVAPLAKKKADAARKAESKLRAIDWFLLAVELEETSPHEAREAYRRALELEPDSLEARVNLGRLLHQLGQLADAEAEYRRAVELFPRDATAWFNLGVVLEDRGRLEESVGAYEIVVELEPSLGDAYYNLARLYEDLGDSVRALRCLRAYKRLTER
ncbi:tetratricopeptide repeat protein [Myxococcota bacterium]|nr:tetratricopeptide repeat protein [Myxococcota bacterium]